MRRRERAGAGVGGRTILRTVKYGQTPLSRPFCRTSASVHMPGGISWPASMSPRFCSGARSGLRATQTDEREEGRTHVVKATCLDGARVVPRALADGGVREIAAARVDDLALFLLGDLPRGRSEGARRSERREGRTSGCMQRFLRLVRPMPVKACSFLRSSSDSATATRYSMRRLSSERAFSISGTVREQ